MEGMIGEIKMFAGNFSPRSWAFCEGQLLSINSNQALFSILGTTYGGDGRTTFGLPDLRGRSPIGPGTGPGLTSYSPGQRVGAESVILGEGQIPAHTHVATATVNADSNAGSSTSPDNAVWASHTEDINSFGTTQNTTMATGAVTVTNAPAGGGQAHENRPPQLVIHYIICLEGAFPSRN